jgi:flavin reductase (DIM6/NTAB) family NADH-FMN oxidoreductase RutF
LIQATQTAVDPGRFRQALGQFPTGVCVVTAFADGGRLGMTMSSFNSLSLDPSLVLFSIDRRAASLPIWETVTRCTINVLAENQKDSSNRFAKPRSTKWEGMRIRRDQESFALLGVAAIFNCVLWAKHDGGDHRIFITEVKRSGRALTGSRWSSARDVTHRSNRANSPRRFGRWIFTTKRWRWI